MKCPKCAQSIKGHANGEKDFRQLTRPQQRAAIANAARLLKAYRAIYNAPAIYTTLAANNAPSTSPTSPTSLVP